MQPKILILCGSDSDLPVMKQATSFLSSQNIAYELHIASAHRTAQHTALLAKDAAARGIKVIICGAGGAAHLAGCVAAQTNLPVIGVPIKNDTLKGVDALYATVQMPPGIPVATVAINGAKNSAILAMQIIALSEPEIAVALCAMRKDMEQSNLQKDALLAEIGIDAYIETKLSKK